MIERNNKATWGDGRYNCHYLNLPGGQGLKVAVTWDDPDGYKVEFLGAALKQRFREIDEAKAAGINLARRKLREALDALPE